MTSGPSKNLGTLIQHYEHRISGFQREYERLPQMENLYEKKHQYLEWLYAQPEKDFREIGRLEEEISAMKEKIRRIRSKEDMTEYILSAMPFLERYSRETSTRGDIFNDYLVEVEGHMQEPEAINFTTCTQCENRMTVFFDEGSVTCENCGASWDIGVFITGMNWEEERDQAGFYSYMRMNHFKTQILAFKGAELTEVPPEVIHCVLEEITKARLYDPRKITVPMIREFLKRHGYNKYYENAIFIRTHVTGMDPPEMTPELERQLIVMFTSIEKAFNEVCPPNRKNFPSYSYIIHKCLQLLGEDDLLPYFPLLKNHSKLNDLEDIWRNITRHLNWSFIPCILDE